MIHDAIYAVHSNVVRIDGEGQCFDLDGALIDINTEAVNSWIAQNQYKQQRAAEYPAIGDQLDALFHAGVFPAEMAAQIQAVKDKYPKGQA